MERVYLIFPVIKIPALNLKMWGKHDEYIALLVACAPLIIAIVYGLWWVILWILSVAVVALIAPIGFMYLLGRDKQR